MSTYTRHLPGLAAIALLALAAAPLQAQRAPAPLPRIFDAHRGWLGIGFDSGTEGWVVRQVVEDSPAERAGLQEGDTIVAVDGAPTTGNRAYRISLNMEPGDTVRLAVRRGGGERRVAVVAGQRTLETMLRPAPFAGRRVHRDSVLLKMRQLMDSARIDMDSIFGDSIFIQRFRVPSAPGAPRTPRTLRRTPFPPDAPRVFLERVEAVGGRAVAGAEFTELTPGLAGYFDGTREGLLVLRVGARTPAAEAGLREGDVVVEAAGRPVREIGDLRRAVRDSESPTLTVVRKGKRLDLKLDRDD